jgi:hypothetical protein
LELTISIIGAIGKKRGMVSAFFVILVVHLIFSIASGSFSLYTVFRDSQSSVNTCANGSDDPDVIKTCQQGVSVLKGLLVGGFIFLWLMEICTFYSWFSSIKCRLILF